MDVQLARCGLSRGVRDLAGELVQEWLSEVGLPAEEDDSSVRDCREGWVEEDMQCTSQLSVFLGI